MKNYQNVTVYLLVLIFSLQLGCTKEEDYNPELNEEINSQSQANDFEVLAAYPITWTDLVNVTTNAPFLPSTITKTSGGNGWNAGAASTNTLSANMDGWVSLTIEEIDTYRMFGLSHVNTDVSWNTIQYCVYLKLGGIDIYENGVLKCGNCQSVKTKVGDKVRVERKGNQILYKLIWSTTNQTYTTTLYSSSTNPNQTLIVDASLYSMSSVIKAVVSPSFL